MSGVLKKLKTQHRKQKAETIANMARNDGHCASVPVGQRLFRLSTRIPNYPFTTYQSIRNFKYSRGCCL